MRFIHFNPALWACISTNTAERIQSLQETVGDLSSFAVVFSLCENKPAPAVVWASGFLRCWAHSGGHPRDSAPDGTTPSWVWRRSCRSWWRWPVWWSHFHIRGEPRRCSAQWRRPRWTLDRPEKCWVGWERRGHLFEDKMSRNSLTVSAHCFFFFYLLYRVSPMFM